MTDLALEKTALNKPDIWLPASVGVILVAVGVAGGLTAAYGYGLFLVASLLLLGSLALLGVLALSSKGDTETLKGNATWLLVIGAWLYLYAVCALSGFYIYETLHGRMEFRWILFGPAILAALIILDYGIYRLLIGRNLPTWQRYRQHISREHSNPAAMRQTLMDDVVLHKSLRSVSGFRWLRHTLIFWGFMLMFFTELLAVVVREAVPAFGLRDIWEEAGHPLRLAFDFAFDTFGLMVLVGCAMAIVWRVMINGTAQQKFTDTPTAVFLLLVVASGFLIEGLRIAAAPVDTHMVSYVGYLVSLLFTQPLSLGGGYEALWLIHVLGSCLFIAYVPLKRLVHSCATPMGRLMNSQKEMLHAKKHASLSGLMGQTRINK